MAKEPEGALAIVLTLACSAAMWALVTNGVVAASVAGDETLLKSARF